MKLLQQSYVKYGLIMTGLLVICLVIMEFSGSNQTFENKNPIFLVYQFIAPAVVWYLGIKEKKKALKNHLTFKQGLKEGFKISLVFGLTSPLIFLIYYTVINPEILQYVKAVYQMTNQPDAVVIAADLFAQLIAAIIFGTLYGAIISFFLKSKKA